MMLTGSIPARWSCSTDASTLSKQLPFSLWSVLDPNSFRTGLSRRTSPCCSLSDWPANRPAIIGEVAGQRALPHEVYEEIITKSDGVPLFAEELTKAVL